MRWRTLLSSAAMLAVLCSTGGLATTGVSALGARAGNSPWTGLFTITMDKKYTTVLGAGASDHIATHCVATITRHADGTASATAIYTYEETEIEGNAQAGNQVTIQTRVPRTVASYPAYVEVPDFTLDGQGGYRVNAEPPSVQILETQITTRQGSLPTTQKLESQAACDPQGGEDAPGRLPGGGTVSGSQTTTLPNGVKIIFTWHIEDPTLGPSSPAPSPRSAGGCDSGSGGAATLSWHGWEICYAGDWRASGAHGVRPAITSTDGRVQITLQVESIAMSSASAEGVIAQIGAAAGGVRSITFRPFVTGALRGQIGIIALVTSHNTLLVAVIGTGTNAIIMETLIRPDYTPLDLIEAGMAMASLQLAA